LTTKLAVSPLSAGNLRILESAPNRLDTLKTLRVANLDGAFATAFLTLVGGSFLVGYIKSEVPGGEADRWIGLLTAIPSFLGLIQIPGAIWGRSFPSFKVFIQPAGIIWRILYLPLALLPILAIAADVKLGIMLGCLTLAAAVINVVNPIYNDWLAEMIPTNTRGTFFGNRNAIMTAIGASVGLAGGYLITQFKNNSHSGIGFTVIFGMGLLCSIISMYFFMQMRDIPRPNPVKQSVSEGIREFGVPFKDREFRRVLIFLAIFIWGQVMAGNLWSAFAFESLKFSQLDLQLCGFTHALGNIMMSKWWGLLADKYGNKPLLMLTGIGMLVTPVAWLFCKEGYSSANFWVLFISHFFMGAIWSGVALCQFNLLLATASTEKRATYIGTGMATQAFIGGVAPLVGAELLARMRGQTASAMGAYHIVFYATILVRAVALLALFRIKEEGSTGLKQTVKVISGVTPGGLRAMRKFNRSGNAEKREAAIQEMAGQGFSLGIDEIIQALHDPSPRVRRQAAVALGKLGNPAAVPELIHQLHDHPDLVEEETVEALGDLANTTAFPELIKLLKAPRPLLRRAAARAISVIPGAAEDEAVTNALTEAAEDSNDPDLRRAALQALRNLEVSGIGKTVAHALLDKRPSVRIAAAEAAAELYLDDTADACRESLTLYDDEASSEVAYALGVVGNMDDVPRILAVAQTCSSMITRRRCLLGVARIYGVENEAYKMLMSSGMERDKMLINLLSVGSKQSKHATNALLAHSEGDEVGALTELRMGKDADILSAYPVPELFLLAACIYSARMDARGKS
jgi:HEAT repeat protein/MFS-type transporter involved in bile tolerance (Atg22 family)